jgi:hypothetical protein
VGSEQEEAFAALKDALCRPGLVLRHPQPGLPFVVHMGWSTGGLGAILTQRHADGSETMVAAISRSLNKHEANYPAWKGELLAVIWGGAAL